MQLSRLMIFGQLQSSPHLANVFVQPSGPFLVRKYGKRADRLRRMRKLGYNEAGLEFCADVSNGDFGILCFFKSTFLALGPAQALKEAVCGTNHREGAFCKQDW